MNENENVVTTGYDEEVSSEEYDEEIENVNEESSEESSEVTTEEVVYLPEQTQKEISGLYQFGLMGVAMFGTMFFLWVFDFLYKKLQHYF